MPATLAKKKCPICKTMFKPATKQTKYCSPECRGDASKNLTHRGPGLKPSRRQRDKVKAQAAPMSHIVPPSGDTLATTDLKKAVETLNVPRDLPAPYDEAAAYKSFKEQGLEEVEFITSGIPEFDKLTKIPRGRITQIQGPYGVGKTTLCLNMVRGLRDHKVLYIDTEAALNPQLLVRLRINPRTFKLWNRSAFIEDVYDVILRSLATPQFDLIILDSLAASTFKTEAEGEPGAANMGQKAKIVNKLMRIAPMELKKTNTALVVINQERETINSYGPVKYTPGGMGIIYAASLIVALKSNKSMRFPKTPPFAGQSVEAEIIKSKVNDPWRKETFKIYYGGENG